MRSTTRILIGLAALASGAAAPALAQTARAAGVIDGVVSDTSLNPLNAAFVSILGTTIRVATGPNGRFRITDLPSGQYLLIVKRGGYRPASAVIDVVARDTLRLSYTLERDITTLEPVVVTEKANSTRMREFEMRRRTGLGEFMGEEEIKQRNSVFTTELMRKFPSIDVSPSRTTSQPVYYALSRRAGHNPDYGACPLQILLDRVPLPTPFPLDLLPSPKDLAAIEVYSASGTVPPQYSGYNRGCGVILIWTKDGT